MTLIGKDINHVEEPGILARSMAFRSAGGSFSCKSVAVCVKISLLSRCMSDFAVILLLLYFAVICYLREHIYLYIYRKSQLT